jgi:hypothetical protein
VLNANPSTLQAINGANPLQVVTSILGNFMYPASLSSSAFEEKWEGCGGGGRTEERAKLEEDDGDTELAEEEEEGDL